MIVLLKDRETEVSKAEVISREKMMNVVWFGLIKNDHKEISKRHLKVRV